MGPLNAASGDCHCRRGGKLSAPARALPAPNSHQVFAVKRRPLGSELDNFLRLDAGQAETSFESRMVGALKPGAFIAIMLAIVIIYLDAYFGYRVDRRLAGLAVGAALFGPAVRVALREWRTRRRPPPQV
jgi:hypothetical protein